MRHPGISMTLPQPQPPAAGLRRLRRLSGAEAISFVSYGLRIGIQTNQPGGLDWLIPLLPPGWRPARAPAVHYLYSLQVGDARRSADVPQVNRLYGNGKRLAQATDLEELLEQFESHLQLFVAEWARRRVFVHAGVVGWRGRAILIPGRSLSGKTTLVTALVRAGATYYSDEYAVLDERGRVHPYPRRLSIREAGGRRRRRCTAEAIGGLAGSRPLSVGLVVVTRYCPGAYWRPQDLSAGRTALALLHNTVPALRKPVAVLDTLQQVVTSARAVKGVRGEAEAMAEALLRTLED